MEGERFIRAVGLCAQSSNQADLRASLMAV